MIRLSSNNFNFKITVTVVVTLFFAITFLALSEISLVKYSSATIVLMVGVFLIYKAYRNSYEVFYNSDNLIIKGKSYQRVICLTRIRKVAYAKNYMRILGVRYNQYSIQIFNAPDTLETVYFLCSYCDDKVTTFESVIHLKKAKQNKV